MRQRIVCGYCGISAQIGDAYAHYASDHKSCGRIVVGRDCNCDECQPPQVVPIAPHATPTLPMAPSSPSSDDGPDYSGFWGEPCDVDDSARPQLAGADDAAFEGRLNGNYSLRCDQPIPIMADSISEWVHVAVTDYAGLAAWMPLPGERLPVFGVDRGGGRQSFTKLRRAWPVVCDDASEDEHGW